MLTNDPIAEHGAGQRRDDRACREDLRRNNAARSDALREMVLDRVARGWCSVHLERGSDAEER
jgi:hypothetical protein